MKNIHSFVKKRVVAVVCAAFTIGGCTTAGTEANYQPSFATDFQLEKSLVVQNSTCLTYFRTEYVHNIDTENYANHYLLDKFYEEVYSTQKQNMSYEEARAKGMHLAEADEFYIDRNQCNAIADAHLEDVLNYFTTPNSNAYLKIAHENTMLNYKVFNKTQK
jgi:hypothetical protein